MVSAASAILKLCCVIATLNFNFIKKISEFASGASTATVDSAFDPLEGHRNTSGPIQSG
jgi:hypothetical protein